MVDRITLEDAILQIYAICYSNDNVLVYNHKQVLIRVFKYYLEFEMNSARNGIITWSEVYPSVLASLQTHNCNIVKNVQVNIDLSTETSTSYVDFVDSSRFMYQF